MHLAYTRYWGQDVCVSRWRVIILIDNIDVSICCELSVAVVHECEWHWQIYNEALYSTSFLSVDSMQFLQTPTEVYSLSKYLDVSLQASLALKSPQPVYSLSKYLGILQASLALKPPHPV